MHPSVEQAIGRDRIRNALKRYENNPADEHDRGIVRAVNSDGSYEVLLDGDVQTARCSPYAKAMVGDRVIVVTTKDGENVLLGRLGGEIGDDTESIPPTIEERFEGIESDILDMRTNKVLCATAAWMYASETMTLSEPISAQDNGVVLVFSFHDGNATQDSNWFHYPILKEFVARHSGQGTLVNMRGLTNENKGNKYLYITDTTIKGHDSNAAEGMSSDGTIYRNQRYLLRYVIGF